jgi:EAL domain-containing protein (putative c-di-GMP-specific phosphodiesterase class I)/DNA-binding response OmpR family regulator
MPQSSTDPRPLDALEPLESVAHTPMLPSLLAGLTILIVDDQPANILLLREILERAGALKLVTTSDPREVAGLVDGLRPDLVLLDLHMPHLDGYAVLEQLRSQQPESEYRPILVLTADITPAAKQRALSLGANDFVTKPFDRSEVVLRTRNLLRTRYLHLQLQAQNRSLADEVAVRTADLRVSESARSELVEALERMQSQASPEETAEAICEEMLGIPGISAAGLAMFTPRGAAVPLAVNGPPGTPAAANRPLPASRAAYLLERARLGPWVEDSIPERAEGEYGEQLAALGFGAGVYAPLRRHGEVVGVLGGAALGSGVGADGLARVLPAVVDRAAVAGAVLAPLVEDRHRRNELEGVIRRIIRDRSFHPVFQPIVELDGGRVIGYEALTRFDDGTPPIRRFAEAEEVGLATDLERVCLEAAVDVAEGLPGDTWLSLNVGPATLLEPDLGELLDRSKRSVVLELTEHMAVPDYGPLKQALGRLRPRFGLAIDDAGAGFASFRHILELEPDYVKLDNLLVNALESDERRQALVAGMRYFAARTGCVLIAEGVEREEERRTLEGMTVTLGQGYLLGRPTELEKLDRRQTSRPFAEPAA